MGKTQLFCTVNGGFNVPLTPSFSIANAVWLEQGGIYAVPNLRGGGEYGKEWHDAGTKEKTNVFDDFLWLRNSLLIINILLLTTWQFAGDLMEDYL